MLTNVVGCFLLLLCLAVFLVLKRAVTLLRDAVETWEMVETHFKQLVEDRRECNLAKYAYRNHARTLERQQAELAEIKEALEAEFRSEKR